MIQDPEFDPLTDESLVKVYQEDPNCENGRKAISHLVSRWSERTYRWTHRFVGEREQALDLAQDCLIQMIQALPRYQSRGRFSAWLFTIVHNRCLDHARRQRSAPLSGVDLDGVAASEPGPEEWMEQTSNRERVLTAMRDHLEPIERTALWLRAYEETSVDDITRMLNLEGASGARGLLQTARRKLRAALGDASEHRGENR